jgi:ubiquinone/menaquinone biosynthesis C-methylase UbiE
MASGESLGNPVTSDMSNWEADDVRHAAQLLFGEYYGDRPEKRFDEIRGIKKKRAAQLCRRLRCNKESVVLEIGSGMGFTSKWIAQEVKHLYCNDISASFLELARKECGGIPNIEFARIDKQPAAFAYPDEFFDIILADAVFIHLNLYDIYWYFSEFERLAKKNGKVFINIRNASKIDMRILEQMAGYYRDDRDSLKMLLCWNTVAAVASIAKHFGFSVVSKGRLWGLYQGKAVDLLFRKG